MTDDIVARLREDFVEQIADEQPYMVAETYKKERHEAADEIERLRAFAEAVVRYAGNAGDDYLADKARDALKEKTND